MGDDGVYLPLDPPSAEALAARDADRPACGRAGCARRARDDSKFCSFECGLEVRGAVSLVLGWRGR